MRKLKKWDKLTEEEKKQKAFHYLTHSNPSMWIIILIFICGITAILWYFAISNILVHNYPIKNIVIALLFFIVINGMLILAIREFIKSLFFIFFSKKFRRMYQYVLNIDVSNVKSKVLLLYCTCNDFCPNALLKSIKQKYSNFETIILDDSTKDEYKAEIDAFAKEHNLTVIRRNDRKDFKAGNLNNYLLNVREKGTYDYFVVLDSDEILPENFITESLKCFFVNEKIGAVMANHISNNNQNFFMRSSCRIATTLSFVDKLIRMRYGFVFDIGHGIIFKKECFEDLGGFPSNIILEDVAMSIEMKFKDYSIFYAPHIFCGEEFPVNFLAMRKRQSKWTRGDVGLTKKYTFKIIFSKKLKFHEKADILICPLFTAFFLIDVFLLNILLFFVIAFHVDTFPFNTIWFFPAILSGTVGPFIPYLAIWLFKMNIFRFFTDIIIFTITQYCLFLTMLISLIFGIFNKKLIYPVTPKSNAKIKFKYSILYNLKEIIAAIIFLTLCLITKMNYLYILTFFLIFSLGVAPILTLSSNISYDKKKIEKIDADIKKRMSEISKKIIGYKNETETMSNLESNVETKVDNESNVIMPS